MYDTGILAFAFITASRLSWSQFFGAFCSIASRVGDDLAGCYGSSPRMHAKDDDWLTSELDVNPGDYSVVARKALPGTCHEASRFLWEIPCD